MELHNGDCLEIMKDIDDGAIDLLFCDLPYGQTSCKWDCLIDLDLFWKEVNRICKDDSVMFFTCSTKFGVSLINSNPKNFRYDLVWVKSSACGFLNAKKMPMKKHEMVYVFYKKLPKIYGECLAEHHTHKFIKETEKKRKEGCYSDNGCKTELSNKYDPPLPTSVIRNSKGDGIETELYGNDYLDKKVDFINRRNGETHYDPPLPTSVIKDDNLCNYDVNKNAYGGGKEGRIKISKDKREHETRYDPPLPTSVIKDENLYIRGSDSTSKNEDVYNCNERMKNGKLYHHARNKQKGDEPIYDPPLPTSVIKDEIYGAWYERIDDNLRSEYRDKQYDPPLPTSVIKTRNPVKAGEHLYGNSKESPIGRYDPPLPNSILEIASQKGKHPTQKPVDLIKWCLKYYSKEGDVVLDPTMGSGSTGVACKEMNRYFVGIEKDETIFKVAEDRLK